MNLAKSLGVTISKAEQIAKKFDNDKIVQEEFSSVQVREDLEDEKSNR